MNETTPNDPTPQELSNVEQSNVSVLDDETRHSVRMLRARAKSFVAQAGALPDPLAAAYRRRARELELEAFLLENRSAARAA